jgi:hypothetical protein
VPSRNCPGVPGFKKKLVANNAARAALFGIYRDAFQRREKAAEDYAIREREKEKLLELKKKLAEQQEHLKRLSDHM